MTNRIAGPGQGLPVPANLYPASLYNGAPFGEQTNELSLAPGDMLPVPAGEWWVGLDAYAKIVYKDPVTGSLRWGPSGQPGSPRMHYVRSDGFNVLVANLTGCLVGGVVTGSSAGWTAATTISANLGGSTWLPVIGGALSTTASITNSGGGYGVPPIVIAPAPPAGGIPSTWVATIGSGTVSGLTCIDQGGGYTSSTITLSIIPSPLDPNVVAGNAITNATAFVTLTGAGSLVGVVCTNPGAALSAVPTLTATGAGTATIAPLWLTVASSLSVSGGGAGYSTTVGWSSFGGYPNATDILTQPTWDQANFLPRPLAALSTVTSAGGTIVTGAPQKTIDKGLFLVTAAKDSPVAFAESASIPSTVGTLVITLGSTNSTVILQPA